MRDEALSYGGKPYCSCLTLDYTEKEENKKTRHVWAVCACLKLDGLMIHFRLKSADNRGYAIGYPDDSDGQLATIVSFPADSDLQPAMALHRILLQRRMLK